MEKRHFETFYQRFFGRIYKFVFYRVGGNREWARDLTQDIFLKAFEAFERYDPARGEVAWIYTIARNHISNAYAKVRPTTDLEEVEDHIRVSTDARETSVTRDEEKRLLAAILELPSDDAQLISMKYLEGWSFDELVEILGKKSGALRVQANRAMKKLRIIILAKKRISS
jgi:RNA polymerase sigma-70 factor (ECF subfamily)